MCEAVGAQSREAKEVMNTLDSIMDSSSFCWIQELVSTGMATEVVNCFVSVC